MDIASRPVRIAGLLLLSLLLGLYVLSPGKPAVQQSHFVGKWKSSKITTPIHLHDNGEWEIRTDDDAVLQYGLWRLEGKDLIWTVKLGTEIQQDTNRVLSVGSNQFQIRENNGSVTTFKRME